MATLIEEILRQILEVVFLALGYYTGIVLVSIMSLGHLHVAYKKDEPLELFSSEKAGGWHITYVEDGKRHVVDWFVCLMGIFFWIGLGLIIF